MGEPEWNWRQLATDLDPEHLELSGTWDQQTPRDKSDLRAAYAKLKKDDPERAASYMPKKEGGAAA